MHSQNLSRPTPPGATTPTPVTAVRLMNTCSPCLANGPETTTRGVPVNGLLRVYVPELRPGSQRSQMEDEERFLLAFVLEPVSHVDRNEQAVPRWHIVTDAIELRRDPARHEVNELFRIGVIVLTDLVSGGDAGDAHEPGARAHALG